MLAQDLERAGRSFRALAGCRALQGVDGFLPFIDQQGGGFLAVAEAVGIELLDQIGNRLIGGQHARGQRERNKSRGESTQHGSISCDSGPPAWQSMLPRRSFSCSGECLFPAVLTITIPSYEDPLC